MNFKEEYKKWLEYEKLDRELKEEMEAMDERAMEEAFSCYLNFGTAGLRGILGAGTNRMNKLVVGLATQGLSEVIKEAGGEEKGVVIAYDSRKYSDAFAKEAASVLAGNGIKVLLFDALRPVPELSFAVRYHKAIAGIVITASHNPAGYNGYKVYWSDGCQMPPLEAEKVHKEMLSTDIFTGVKRAEESNLITLIGKETDEVYYEEVLKLSLCKSVAAEKMKKLKIVYTPLHGSGNVPVREVLKRAGFENVTVVKEQELPDPAFSTVKSPNPEDKEGFALAFGYADKVGADIVIGTDPDCDRVGTCLSDGKGGYLCLTGNQIGVLLTDYIIEALKDKGELPGNGAVIRSIVSTRMVEPVCEASGVKLVDVLTGFKYIGGKIDEFEESGKYSFLFGFEESCGYLSGKHARDKDGVNASLLICEMTAFYKAKGTTIYDRLMKLYETYGFYNENVVSITFSGLEGMAKIKAIMENVRANPITEMAGIKVNSVIDYKTDNTGLPSADVIRLDFSDNSTLFIRPSGTEPKIKGYIMTVADNETASKEKGAALEKALREIME